MKTKLLASSIFLLTAGAVAGYPYVLRARPAPPLEAHALPLPALPLPALPYLPKPVGAQPAIPVNPNGRPKIEAVFVLDTTGSMSGLIAAAKENIWSIASTMASAQPAPEVRIGLVAFRDRGDAYVTRVVDLSRDLDSMYATLMDFRAEGGGDGPESVNQALYDAVHKVSWSTGDDAYRVVFLVGDAPPHMDYLNDVQYPETLKAAVAKGIMVNTIQVGNSNDTRQEWEQIASLNQGQYFQVKQNGDAIAVTTPFDDQIATLSRSLDETRMFYGDADTQRASQKKEAATDKLHAEGSAASRAKRAAFNSSSSGKVNFLGDDDLIDALDSGKVNLASIDRTLLPARLREMSKDDQAREIQETAAKRADLNRQIKALSEQRQSFIDSELKKRDGGKDSLDYKIFGAVKKQAAKKGMRYELAPRL